MIRAFKEGYEEFKQGDLYAAQKFNEAELLFQSAWAPKAALMAAGVLCSRLLF